MQKYLAATALLAMVSGAVGYSKHYDLDTATLTIETKHHFRVDKGKIDGTDVRLAARRRANPRPVNRERSN